MAPSTIPHLVLDNGRRLGSAPAYHVRGPGGWEATSWAGYAAEVRRAGAALVALGVEPGQAVGILGANRPEWVVTDVAAMAAGAVPAGIYATSSATECEYILAHCEAPVLLVEDTAQWEKIAAVRPALPRLRHVVTMAGAPVIDEPGVLSWEEFLARGDDPGAAAALDDRLGGLRPEGVATYIYTSGTTGRPKAVMLTHDNLSWTATQGAALAGAVASDRLLSYLPLAHVAEQMFTIHIAAVAGTPVYYCGAIEALLEHLVDVKPTLFFGVPRVWEKFHAGAVAKLAETGGRKAKIVTRAMAIGRHVHSRRNRGLEASLVDEAWYRVYDRIIYRKVKAALGLGEARLCASGAAPVAKEILEFFAAFGLPVHEVYGQSEDTGPTTFNVPGHTRFGTVGPVFPGVDVKLGADGEVLVRGRNVFAGYLKDEAATAEVLADGWLHSGDLGEFDAEGFLTITGRKKDIIITAGGKNVAPAPLETALRNHPLVAEAVVVGDRRRYLVALVALDPEAAERWRAEHPRGDVADEIQRAVNAVNGELARVEQIKRFAILPRALTMADGELTPTLKVRRNVVVDHFADEIEALYEE